jgi:hypothetical protein
MNSAAVTGQSFGIPASDLEADIVCKAARALCLPTRVPSAEEIALDEAFAELAAAERALACAPFPRTNSREWELHEVAFLKLSLALKTAGQS